MMTERKRKWVRRILAGAIVLLTAALLGVFSPHERDARLSFTLRSGGSTLQLTLPGKCTIKTFRRGEGAETAVGSVRIVADNVAGDNGFTAELPLAADAAAWEDLEQQVRRIPAGCRWTVSGAELPPDQPAQTLEIVLHGPSEVMQEWSQWCRLLD